MYEKLEKLILCHITRVPEKGECVFYVSGMIINFSKLFFINVARFLFKIDFEVLFEDIHR